MILFECPGMIRPLDTATLARRRIIPFWGRKDMILGFRSKRFCLWTGPYSPLEHSRLMEKIVYLLFLKFFFFLLSARGPTHRRISTRLAELWGGRPIELGTTNMLE